MAKGAGSGPRFELKITEKVSNLRGSLHYAAQRDLELAESDFRSAIELSPYYAGPHIGLGNIYYIRGDMELAAKEYETALRLNPTRYQARHGLGNIYLTWGMVDRSIEEYQKAINIREDFAPAHYSLGLAYDISGDTDRAIESLTKALELAGPDEALGELARKRLEMIKGRVPATVKATSTPQSPTATPTWTPTSIPPTETLTPTPTSLPPAQPAGSPLTGVPSSAKISVETPTPPPPPPTVTPTVTPTPTLYPAPVLLEPSHDTRFEGGTTLQWQWDGQLGSDEFFDVRVWREGDLYHAGIAWVKVQKFDLNLRGFPGGKHYWSIAVIRGHDPKQKWEGVEAWGGILDAELSQESEVRSF